MGCQLQYTCRIFRLGGAVLCTAASRPQHPPPPAMLLWKTHASSGRSPAGPKSEGPARHPARSDQQGWQQAERLPRWQSWWRPGRVWHPAGWGAAGPQWRWAGLPARQQEPWHESLVDHRKVLNMACWAGQAAYTAEQEATDSSQPRRIQGCPVLCHLVKTAVREVAPWCAAPPGCCHAWRQQHQRCCRPQGLTPAAPAPADEER